MAVLTVSLTVISGVITYVLGQIALKLFIEPVQELKKTIGAISHSFIERANVIYNPGVLTKEVMDETSKELRKLASQLRSHLYLIPAYPRTARIFWLPALADIHNASKALIGLANGVHEVERPDNPKSKYVKMVCDSLRIYHP